MGKAVEHTNLSDIARESGSHRGILEKCQRGRSSIAPEAEGGGNAKKTMINTGNSGERRTGKQIH